MSIIALAGVASMSAEAAGPIQLGSFLRNEFDYVIQHDSFFVCAMGGGIGSFELVADSASELLSFTLRDFHPLETPAHSIKSDGVILVSYSLDGVFTFFDLSALPHILRRGAATYQNEIQDFLPHAGNVYFAEEFNGVTMHRIDNFNNLVFVDSTMRPIRAVQLALRSDTLFVLDDYNGIVRFAGASSGLSENLAYMYLPFQSTGFTISGKRLLLGDGDRGFQFAPFNSIGFAGPLTQRSTVSFAAKVLESDSNFIVISSPKIIETQSKTDAGDVRFIEISGGTRGAIMGLHNDKQLFVTPSDVDGLGAYWMNTFDYPRLIARYDHPGPIRGLEVINDFLYTGGETNPLEKYDPRAGFPPRLEGARDFPDNIRTMTTRADTLYIVDSDARRTWVVKAVPDSLPRPLRVFFGGPGEIDQIELFPDESRGRKVFILRAGASFYMSRAENGEMFSPTMPLLDLGPGVVAVAFANNRLYHYTSKGFLVVNSSTFFFTLNETNRMEMPDMVFDILPVNNDSRLLLLTPGKIIIMNISDRDNPSVIEEVLVAGDYRSATVRENLIFAIGPQSTGMLRYENGTISEVFHVAEGGDLVTAGQTSFFTSDGGSILMYDYLSTSVLDEDRSPTLPGEFRLISSFPNPFNGETLIQFNGEAAGSKELTVEVYNVLGRKVRDLAIGESERNSGRISWDARDNSGARVASGIYLARLRGDSSARSLKMIYLK